MTDTTVRPCNPLLLRHDASEDAVDGVFMWQVICSRCGFESDPTMSPDLARVWLRRHRQEAEL